MERCCRAGCCRKSPAAALYNMIGTPYHGWHQLPPNGMQQCDSQPLDESIRSHVGMLAMAFVHKFLQSYYIYVVFQNIFCQIANIFEKLAFLGVQVTFQQIANHSSPFATPASTRISYCPLSASMKRSANDWRVTHSRLSCCAEPRRTCPATFPRSQKSPYRSNSAMK